MAGKTNTSATYFAQKKLLGKAHTSNLKTDGEELIGSNIQTATSLVFGKISNKKPMNIVSQMPENGVIFSDGIEADFLEFNSGTCAVITTAEKKGMLVV